MSDIYEDILQRVCPRFLVGDAAGSSTPPYRVEGRAVSMKPQSTKKF